MLVPSNVPVFVQDFKAPASKKERYSTAKLKIFYVGETADHRLFTKDFSDKILKTLPLTPVVGYYDEESDDFKGHNDVQFIYGVVPESAEITYEKDEASGNTFAVTDVVLYTERDDNISEIAKKIVGKQHSLEIKPETLKYKCNYDAQGHLMNLQFLDGVFSGLSVLGDDETPAFTGSGFFKNNEQALFFIERYKTSFESFMQFLNEGGGKIKVFNREEYFNTLRDSRFIRTMQQFQDDIYRALDSMGVYGFLVENTTDYAVVSEYDEEENRCKYVRYTISGEGDAMALTDATEVVVQYVPVQAEPAAATITPTSFETPKKKDDEDKDDDDVDTPEPDVPDPDSDPDTDDEEKKKKASNATAAEDANTSEPAPVEPVQPEGVENATTVHTPEDSAEAARAQATATIQNEEATVGEMGTSTASANSTALSDSERAELESYRRLQKLNIVQGYVGDLAEDVIKDYTARIDAFTVEALTSELAIKYRNAVADARANRQAEQAAQAAKLPTTFSTITSEHASYDANNTADVVKKYKS